MARGAIFPVERDDDVCEPAFMHGRRQRRQRPGPVGPVRPRGSFSSGAGGRRRPRGGFHCFTDDSAGDANVSRQRLTLGARSSAGPRVRDYGPLDGGGPVGVEQRSKRKPCVQCAVGVARLASSALEGGGDVPMQERGMTVWCGRQLLALCSECVK